MKKPLMAAIAVVIAALAFAQPAEARDNKHHDQRHGKHELHYQPSKKHGHYQPPKNMVLIKQAELKKLKQQAAKKAAPKVIYAYPQYKPYYHPPRTAVRYVYTPSGQWRQVAYYQHAPQYAYPRVSIW
jgi:hypothetical protein